MSKPTHPSSSNSRWNAPPRLDTPSFATVLGTLAIMVSALFAAIVDGARQPDASALAAQPAASAVVAAVTQRSR